MLLHSENQRPFFGGVGGGGTMGFAESNWSAEDCLSDLSTFALAKPLANNLTSIFNKH